jgi:hypothetical protein
MPACELGDKCPNSTHDLSVAHYCPKCFYETGQFNFLHVLCCEDHGCVLDPEAATGVNILCISCHVQNVDKSDINNKKSNSVGDGTARASSSSSANGPSSSSANGPSSSSAKASSSSSSSHATKKITTAKRAVNTAKKRTQRSNGNHVASAVLSYERASSTHT